MLMLEICAIVLVLIQVLLNCAVHKVMRGQYPFFMCFLLLLFLFQCVPVCVYRLHFKFQRLDAALLRI